MGVGALIPLEEYLDTSYRPDREYRDGVVTERNVGDNAHADLQLGLGSYLRVRQKQWKIHAYTEFRICAREGWYPVADICACPLPVPKERFPTTMPLLWIEILSQSDLIVDVWRKAKELVACGAPYVWIIEPNSLDSQLMTSAGGPNAVPDKTLRVPDTPIVIPLIDVMNE